MIDVAGQGRIILKIGKDREPEARDIGPARWNGRAWEYPARYIIELAGRHPNTLSGAALHALAVETGRRRLDERRRAQPGGRGPAHLYEHQKKAFALAFGRSFCLFMGTGTGKTAVVIAIIEASMPCRTLVIAPLSILELAWATDVNKFAPGLSVSVVAGTKKKRLAAMDRGADIYVVNYEAYKIHAEAFREKKFDIMVLDESSKIKGNSPVAQCTKAILKHAPLVPIRYCMSGTPAPNIALEYFNQAKFVDPDIFGPYFTHFRYKYGTKFGSEHWQWAVTATDRKKLMDKIRPISYHVDKDDCLDLPTRTDTVLSVEMTSEQRKIYKRMLDQMIVKFRTGTITAANSIIKMGKLRQITSGFCMGADGADEIIRFKHGKIKLLKDTLEQLGGEQVLIWAQFQEEIRDILKVLGPKAVSYYGQTSKSDRRENVDKFLTGRARYLVAHPKSLGHGVTLVNCRYAIYYSLSYSLEEYYQSRDRIYRIGQKRKVQYFHFLAPKTVDVEIYKVLAKKGNVSDALLGMLK